MRPTTAQTTAGPSEALFASRTYLPITAGGRGPVTRRARSVSCASPQPHRGGGLDRAKALRYPAAQNISAQDPVAQLGRVAQTASALAQSQEGTAIRARLGMNAEENLHLAQAVPTPAGESTAVNSREGIAQKAWKVVDGARLEGRLGVVLWTPMGGRG